MCVPTLSLDALGRRYLRHFASLDCIGRRSSVRAGYIPMFAADAAGCALPGALKAEAHEVMAILAVSCRASKCGSEE